MNFSEWKSSRVFAMLEQGWTGSGIWGARAPRPLFFAPREKLSEVRSARSGVSREARDTAGGAPALPGFST